MLCQGYTMKKLILVGVFLSTILSAENILSEVQKNGLTIIQKDNTKLIITRVKHALCTKHHITPESLFGGNYAGEKVPDVCKKSFVTKVGVLQPMTLSKNIKTVGELEVLAHIKKVSLSPETHILIDARTPKWHKQMTIPTSINLSFNTINYSEDLDEDDFQNKTAFIQYEKDYKNMFKILNIKKTKNGLDFSQAKSAVFYCNGSWCSQSPKAIMKLINIGYPEEKLLWYRGGLQDWVIYDFTVESSAKLK
jgi:rhodanese-related sulfurtransferase